MKKNAVLLALLFSLLFASAQNRTVIGKVMDDRGAALANVSVVVKNTNIGTTTTPEGMFSINVPINRNVLVFSYINMTEREIDITNQSSVTVTMRPNERTLSEVVVTALGIAKDKRSLGYATQTVKGAEIANKGELNVLNALQGRLAGVNIIGASGGPELLPILIYGAFTPSRKVINPCLWWMEFLLVIILTAPMVVPLVPSEIISRQTGPLT
jgi:hypothetical protein